MTIKFTVFDATTNEELRSGSTMSQATADLQAGPGEYVKTEGFDPMTEYVESGTGEVKPRTLMNRSGVLTSVNKTTIAGNGVDFLTISNIPNGAGYHFVVPENRGIAPITPATVADGTLEITTMVDGAYMVVLTYPNMLNFKVNFNAT
jgi:hypothetical protein